MGTALIVAAGFLAVLFFGFVWQILAEAADRKSYPPRGIVRDLQGSRLHIYSTGEGPISVILEAGIAASSVGWARVQPELASFCRVCAYDRPGLGWSPPSNRPRTPDQFLEDLRAVVQHAGHPAILVGHSFGGLLIRLYASRYPEDVLGLVLADPALLTEWSEPNAARLSQLNRGVQLSRRGALLAQIGFVRLSLGLLSGGAQKLSKLFAQLSSGKGASVTERLVGEVRKLPEELWPIVRSQWCRPSAFRSMAEHLEVLPAVSRQVASSPIPSSVPVFVISGAHLRADQLREHQELARASDAGVHVIAERSGHWVHLDRPDVIVDAVRKLILKS